jgi:hypothetical protein
MGTVGRYAKRLQPVVGNRRMLRASLVLCKQADDMGGVLDCYARDPEPAYQAQVFDYISEVIGSDALSSPRSRESFTSSPPTMTERALAMKDHIMDKLSDLLVIDQEKVGHWVVGFVVLCSLVDCCPCGFADGRVGAVTVWKRHGNCAEAVGEQTRAPAALHEGDHAKR